MSRPERILAYMFAATVGLSIIAILVVLIMAGLGQVAPAIFAVLPMPGLGLGFLLLIALVIVGVLRRRRDAKDDRR